MKTVLDILIKIFSNNLVRSVLVVAAGALIYKFVSFLLLRRARKSRLMKTNKGETYLRLTISIVKYTILVLTVLLLLQVNDVNVTSVVAGIGIVSVVLGLAVQDALQDIIRGFSIISDEYFRVGDMVSYNGTEGKVLELGLKTTKIRELRTNHILSIPNRAIKEMQLLSDMIYINVPLPYELKLGDAEAIMNEITAACQNNDLVKSTSYLGVNELADSAIRYLFSVQCVDNQFMLKVRRDCLHVVLEVLEQHKVAVPYNQLDVHTRREKE